MNTLVNRCASRVKNARNSRSNRRIASFESLEHRHLLAADLGLLDTAPLDAPTESTPAQYENTTSIPSTFQEAGLMLDYGNASNGLPLLSSNPSAAAKIYLDFDGHFEPQWGAYSNITTPVWSLDGNTQNFNSTEAARIRAIWRRVAEDFAPFNIDVTTIEPASFANREGLRVSIGGNGSWYGNAGGVAYRNTWTNSIVNTVYVFPGRLNNNASYIAEVASHETGHAFGLYHQSTYDNSGSLTNEYNPGSGNWAPIMGYPLGKARTTWHNGTSTSATTFQDDLAVISSTFNGFGYRQDDHGGLNNPTALTLDQSGLARAVGVIERSNDVDAFTFEVTARSEGNFQVDVFNVGPNLRARLELWSDSGVLLVSANPNSTFGASFTHELDPGRYTLAVQNDGSYGSLGHYTVNVNVMATDSTPPLPEDDVGQDDEDADDGGDDILDPGDQEDHGDHDHDHDHVEKVDIILDSESTSGISIVGTWLESSVVPQYHGNNYLHDNNAHSTKSNNSVTFTPTIGIAGEYEVYMIWAEHSNRASNVPVDIVHAGGTHIASVNQRVNGGTWNLLGTFTFDAGTDGRVRIRTNGTNGVVIADAVRFVSLADTTPPTAELSDPAHEAIIEQSELNGRGYLDVTFTDDRGSLDIASILDSEAEFTLVGTAAAGVTVSGSPTWISDTTFRYDFSGKFTEGLVEVHFLANSFRDPAGNGNLASVQSFTVFREPIAEIEEILLDSEIGEGIVIAGTWFESTAVPQYHGENYLHDNNAKGGKGTSTVTYTPTIVTAGEYEVYMIWAEHSNRASNVPVDIIHAGGTHTASVNQRVNGGTWNLLGTFTFDTGTDGRVRIRTNGTNGVVIADAVRFVPANTPSGSPSLARAAAELDIKRSSLSTYQDAATALPTGRPPTHDQNTLFAIQTSEVSDCEEAQDGQRWEATSNQCATEWYFGHHAGKNRGFSDFELLAEEVLNLLAKRS